MAFHIMTFFAVDTHWRFVIVWLYWCEKDISRKIIKCNNWRWVSAFNVFHVRNIKCHGTMGNRAKYHKNLTNFDCQRLFNYPKIWTMGVYRTVMCQKAAPEMANDADPDQTAPSDLNCLPRPTLRLGRLGLSFAFLYSLTSKSTCTVLTSSWPFIAHMCSGVLPSLSTALMSAPKCTSNNWKCIS